MFVYVLYQLSYAQMQIAVVLMHTGRWHKDVARTKAMFDVEGTMASRGIYRQKYNMKDSGKAGYSFV